MLVVIPAFQPTVVLPRLVEALLEARPSLDVLVVDDGSDLTTSAHVRAAAAAGAEVLRLPFNRGKGNALRTAFAHLHEVRAAGPVVTADADGQHAVEDILAVGDAVDVSGTAGSHLVLGQRRLDMDVPIRSRVGNTVTRLMFRAATGQRLHDTQTGLRAFPASLLPWLTTLRGDRYEYELVMLLQAARRGVDLVSVPIRTIYLEDNSSSHFRPVIDSVRIYAPLLTFLATSLSAFVLDATLVIGLYALFGSLLPAVVLARLVSGTVNFTLNRRLVFRRGSHSTARRTAAGRYLALATALLGVNYLLLSALHAVGLPLPIAKLLTEVTLVATSYSVQARFVFACPATGPADRVLTGTISHG